MAAPRRRRGGFIVLGVVLAALLVWLWFATHPPHKQTKTPSVPVSVAKVTSQDVPIVISGLGAAQAWQSVLITAQVSGKLIYVANEGDYVPAGALLAEIDPAPYNAALVQAQGALRRDQALLQE